MSLNLKGAIAMAGWTVLLSVPALLGAASLGKNDAAFMKLAAKTSMTEAHLGQMAEAQASRQAVKDFGQQLSKDHTTAYEELTVLANKTGETIPKAIGHDQTIVHLTHLKGAGFDHAFLADEVQSHKAALATFKNEAEKGDSPDVKGWAKSMIPTLEGHLKTAEDLAKKR
jgi:putative membrane protein